MTRRLPILIAWIAAVAAPALAADFGVAPTDSAALLHRAESAYDRGVGDLPSDPAKAKAEFVESAAAYRELAGERGIRNARLLANMGNAYMLSGDTGRAVLAYRRAAAIDPTDESVLAGLRTARSRVGISVDTGPTSRALAWVSGWRGIVEPRFLLMIGAWSWAAGWLGLGLARLRPSARRLARAGAAGAILGGLCMAVVLVDNAVRRSSRDAVLIADGVIGRNGPGGAAYEPSFDKALAPGLELSIDEERGDWIRVRLADGRQTWVPRSALERI